MPSPTLRKPSPCGAREYGVKLQPGHLEYGPLQMSGDDPVISRLYVEIGYESGSFLLTSWAAALVEIGLLAKPVALRRGFSLSGPQNSGYSWRPWFLLSQGVGGPSCCFPSIF